MLLGIDIGSTTCKYVLADDSGKIIDKAYERHNTRQAEKVLEFLIKLEELYGLRAGRDRVYLTGSGAGQITKLIGGKFIQEVVAVSVAVERLHPRVRFVSEIGGEDMKTIFIKEEGGKKSRQVYMQNVCAGGTGTFIEKSARKLGIDQQKLSSMGYRGYTLHRISSKCGIFAEADVNSLVKAGVPVEEIIASLFEAVVYQNLSQLTKGNTPLPEVLLLGGPNLFFRGLQEAWRHHLKELWKVRGVGDFSEEEMQKLVYVPENSLFYASLGCIYTAMEEEEGGVYQGREKLEWWVKEGQYEEKLKEGKRGLVSSEEELEAFMRKYSHSVGKRIQPKKVPEVIVGCDFGSTTAKAVCITPEKELVFSCYTMSKGNPIEDAKEIFRQIKEYLGSGKVLSLGITGYGKDLLKDILGADVAIVETVAHATAGLHFFPDADCICDVGGVDVKIMILRQGSVVDFRLNSQCSSGNGAFLQGVAERFNIPLSQIAERAFLAKAIPNFTMGCGVFLQSDIVNQQRKGWQAEEILAGLCYVLPLNVWIYAGNINNLAQVGRKFILQGGTHRNLAVVKAQVDFIKSRVPDAEVYVHPYSGEAGAIGAALVALEHWRKTKSTRFRGFQTVENLEYVATTSKDTVCHWCPVNCQRTFIDVKLQEGEGRPWSKVPLPKGWVRLIVNNSCPKGLVEDEKELRVIKERMEKVKSSFPNISDFVRKEAFRRLTRT
ncbi:CoA-substrate-specific enzyme activase [Hydrogenobacter thermophilus TK-6]|uniref:Putative CoA-substrate-specific enzyme activase n=1 Tax=Hydrogenobacter thermophilus (strain DSM 6534 / IAM 12695 / TK-6) TaxID=608538 RepID=D3DHU3_HYDTT|nr:BadF/BadG/BcrA/BcrD ATPase family protein [Hydrogenobacter thermophilus]ADO45328.1 CoA-substrate-specific enzyme activase [Hydrogenobacter thermophilus TK-6]BAI69395.1 putative CoA-substrate-specific enzyme activase [Hydrogenobacter thermophilus TK-6]